MNRANFRKLAQSRIKEAKLLFNNGYFDAAYYLLGYAVECALKACIAKNTKRHDFPPDKDAIYLIYSHNLENLIGAGGLRVQHQKEKQKNAAFNDNWNLVSAWDPEVRYELGKSESAVRDFFSAVLTKPNGVLTWLSQYW